jgi:CRISPR/Cas system-associated exonuclease Cas4 (RecB family)
MCGGGEPDYIGNAIESIKKIKKPEITEQLSNELYQVMNKLQAILDARPKPVDDPNDHCPCGCI